MSCASRSVKRWPRSRPKLRSRSDGSNSIPTPISSDSAWAVIAARGKSLARIRVIPSLLRRWARRSACSSPRSDSGVFAGCMTRSRLNAVSPWRIINRLMEFTDYFRVVRWQVTKLVQDLRPVHCAQGFEVPVLRHPRHLVLLH